LQMVANGGEGHLEEIHKVDSYRESRSVNGSGSSKQSLADLHCLPHQSPSPSSSKSVSSTSSHRGFEQQRRPEEKGARRRRQPRMSREGSRSENRGGDRPPSPSPPPPPPPPTTTTRLMLRRKRKLICRRLGTENVKLEQVENKAFDAASPSSEVESQRRHGLAAPLWPLTGRTQ